MSWTCPRCDRTFGSQRAHECQPALPLDYWLDERTPDQRSAAEAVLAIARRKRGLVIEAVYVGVFIKRERTIIELRPKTKWLQLSFVTSEHVDSPKITREVKLGARTAYFMRLRDATDVDGEVRGWLARALAATKR